MVELNISHQQYTEAMENILSHVEDIHDVSCHIEFGADHSQSKIIRDFVGMIFDAHDIHVPWRWRFILITDELINNAIEHGSIEDDMDSCIIEARRWADGIFRISLEVHDTGKGKDSGSIHDIGKAQTTTTWHDWVYMGKRGRWLFHITEKLVDSLSFAESPKWWLAVRVEKSISPDSLATV